MAAGTVTITEKTWGSVKYISFAWTAGTDAEAGTAEGTTTAAFDGQLERVVTIPGTAGDQPLNLYGVTVSDPDGLDLLLGNGAGRSNAAAEQITSANLAIVAGQKLTMNITAAGASKKGTVKVYLR